MASPDSQRLHGIARACVLRQFVHGEREACAAFCGPLLLPPISASSLIGGVLVPTNAGSGTTFSNHAYKMGPMHGTGQARRRQAKLSARRRQPSVHSPCVSGKLMRHYPNTFTSHCPSPTSYIVEADKMFLVPATSPPSVFTVIRKWPKRDGAPSRRRSSTSTGQFFSVGDSPGQAKILENLRQAKRRQRLVVQITTPRRHQRQQSAQGIKDTTSHCASATGAVLKRRNKPEAGDRKQVPEMGRSVEFLLPCIGERRLIGDIKNGSLTIQEVVNASAKSTTTTGFTRRAWTYRLILEYYGITVLH